MANVRTKPAPKSAPAFKYVMTISRMTVDKLGVKLYDRVSAVIAELVSNSYDADATTVTIKAPMASTLPDETKTSSSTRDTQSKSLTTGAA
jgi:phage tail protein X